MTTRMDAADHAAFAEAISRTLDAGGRPDAGLAELGWHDALGDYPADAVPLLFEAQGRTRTTSSALEAVLCRAAGLDCVERFVLPRIGTSYAPGTLRSGRLSIHGLVPASVCHATEALVIAATDDDHVLLIVDTSVLDPRPVAGMDPSMGLSRIDADGLPSSACTAAAGRAGAAAGRSRVERGPEPVDGTNTSRLRASWPDVLAAGQLALAHELVGLSRAMLEMARTHALVREQFGRPIATFQAVRHRLAEALVAVESAAGAAEAAWDSPGPVASSMAKAIAGRSALTVARHAQQVLAGMGFTAEHDFHRYYRRALVLDHLLGSSRRLTEDLGRQLLTWRELPPMLPL